MANKWWIDLASGTVTGALVTLSTDEEAQRLIDLSTGGTMSAQQSIWVSNYGTIVAGIAARLANIRTARQALAGGTIFSGLSTNEKAVIDGLLQDDLYFGRMLIEAFDATT